MKLPFTTDDGIGSTATLGVVVLQTDQTIEHEFARICTDDGISLHHTRIPMCPEITPTTLMNMLADLPSSVSLLSNSNNYDVIGYACTSAATVIGSEKIQTAIQQIHPNTLVTDPLDSLIAACKALEIEKIAFISPYIASVSEQLREKLTKAGLQITSFASFEEGDDDVVARISPSSVLEAIKTISQTEDCDAIIVSCTNLRILEILNNAEYCSGKPVISSNLALAWNMLRLAQALPCRNDLGQLFRQCGSKSPPL
ncbi:maleate cis-trans isomerase family protein [Cohaesibacter gelatinilyticus]|uniref:Maleate isomerase n=1 Tax=Cohaesibacter gelatinilyticus TaxID=372072 RepID=A0A285NI53_9HYPH|nr:aspartate/glutamate racemase family protein [Cohaesibacter gelatinilyticus]SNZ08657.1 maleate isomerase [Cohaesibacter gelatinilyticus]HAT84995.1 Asp/Glu racemase [Hyphomicrobiales bacterium]